jgi:hypothetical protein
MDEAIRLTQRHRKNLISAGHIDHFGRPVTPQQPQQAAVEPVTHSGHCMKCQTKVDALTQSVEDHPNGAKRAVGKCPTCGTGVHAFMKATDGQKLQDLLKASGGVMPQ